MKAVLAIAAIASMLLALPVHAQLGVSAGFEYFRWTEDTDPIEVQERGALFVLGLDYTQQKEKGWLVAYRGRAYTGDVDYDGALLFSPSTPATGTSSYLGMSNEAQVRYRFPPKRGSYSLDLLSAVGYDFWERELSDFQQEDYQVAFLRFGVELNPVGNKGWLLNAGIKYPVWIEEDAHFDDAGYDQNPELEPGRGASLFAQVGYRFQRHLALIVYLDGYNLQESDPVFVTQGGIEYGFLQPESTQYNIGIRLQYLF